MKINLVQPRFGSVAITVTLSALIFGQEPPISTDRGTAYSSSPLIVLPGKWQIEAGYTNTRVGNDTTDSFGELLLRYPLSTKFELRFSNVAYIRAPGISGFADPAIGFKLKLIDGGPNRPDLATILTASIPAGARDLRVDRTQVTLHLPWYLALDASTGIGGMLGVSDLGPGEVRFTQYHGGLYVSRTLDPKTTAYLELFGLSPVAKDGPDSGIVDFAVGHLLNTDSQIDFRVGTAFNRDRDGWFFGGGIAFRF